MHKKFWLGHLLVYSHLEQREGDGRITLRWILRKYVVRIGDSQSWLRIVVNNDKIFGISGNRPLGST
jgi:hypothetical protein